MTDYDSMRRLDTRVEVLAPAGRWDALEAVITAGADAVYLSAKRFNMRHHRGDFHFTDDQLSDAITYVHQHGRRIYVTVNALLGQSELADARDLLAQLDALGVDAIIIQDLGTIHLARELDLDVPLHASTMMNVHHPEHARALKKLGITRIIPSRDISLTAIGEICRLAGIEVECFVHGDMCVAQSGQCSMSGVLFGKSANRGECMKPCRWEYDLVRLDEDASLAPVSSGHLLSIKDLCLLRNIPEAVQSGVCSLKIEGRMRDAPYLTSVVQMYRNAVDAYYECPPAFALSVEDIENAHRNQVRKLSTLTMLGGSSHSGLFDTTGRTEPMFLSNGCTEQAMTEQVFHADAARDGVPRETELAVSVADESSAQAAVEGGADRIYLAAEVSQLDRSPWSLESLTRAIRLAQCHNVRVGLRTPRVTTDREWFETRWILRQLSDHDLDFVLVHHLGTLELARIICPQAAIITDFGFNTLNAAAAELLAQQGATQVTLSNEAGFIEFQNLADATPVPLEVIAHGPVSGMLVDHCVIALHASTSGRKDVCRAPCRHVAFGLRDKCGETRPVIADQHCRNHLLAAHDLAILPRLNDFLVGTVRSVRIEAQFYTPAEVQAITRAYRRKLDADTNWQAAWREAQACSPRPLNYGPFTRSIVNPKSTASVIREFAH